MVRDRNKERLMKLGTVSVMADGTNGNKSGRKRDGENWSTPEKRQAKPEFALELDHPRAYTLFLQKSTEEFLEDYQERYRFFGTGFRAGM